MTSALFIIGGHIRGHRFVVSGTTVDKILEVHDDCRSARTSQARSSEPVGGPVAPLHQPVRPPDDPGRDSDRRPERAPDRTRPAGQAGLEPCRLASSCSTVVRWSKRAYGEGGWVANVRAGCEATVTYPGGRSLPVQAIELAPEDAGRGSAACARALPSLTVAWGAAPAASSGPLSACCGGSTSGSMTPSRSTLPRLGATRSSNSDR